MADAKNAAKMAKMLKKEEEEEEHGNKLIRILTVGAYLGSLSAGASTLAFYYLFLWDSMAAVRAYQKDG
jgi:molybdenum-dependent DNA-binding transcriptional regulator ModE